MSVDLQTVRRAARLARIYEPESRLESLARELNAILGWIDLLEEVDVEGVEAMTSAVELTLPLRDDVISDGGQAKAIVANAPQSADGFFVVPKVVE
ncbi:Asp-tRNA(Asn)/Glu-tRNA(Gln) amidotransferase subunit GatC [Candidatus Phycosocius spiralis]|uniref:Aspartyl/glutamyl-tRNA(Asn/Gln) amidotransferase subunit C n=1 Tax=Candidatus Phycosocius spiralis TaxID=2815099 RepID=A0ABQ4PXY0_9PROT|nr:Asp-tRNA(Asn)/Glu-tRNA(Gln) amidotransferase subunit GatC [Candidatus Phycosocius spiralis]GIU67873.1 glutamyl-tRNA(Gln) amidotransferase subunit C [Candidatus Phycosocius spiralis]